jgi:nucleotide-binding universal stress UspA family protein
MNAIQSILVHVDASASSAARLQFARTLGGQLGAAVTALYAVTPVYVEMALNVAAGGVSDALLAIDEQRLAAARRQVADASAGPGVQIEWQQAREAPEYAFIQQALFADLLVLGQHDRDQRDAGVPPDFVPSVLIASGKPALVVPYIGAPAILDTVFVAWKQTPQAAHALTAALPLLRAATAVHIGIDADLADDSKAALQAFLRRHGVVDAQLHTLIADAPQAGELMLSMAADVNADLMVMGCYGHSRARELVLGGASRTVLGSMTLPVLMAH